MKSERASQRSGYTDSAGLRWSAVIVWHHLSVARAPRRIPHPHTHTEALRDHPRPFFSCYYLVLLGHDLPSRLAALQPHRDRIVDLIYWPRFMDVVSSPDRLLLCLGGSCRVDIVFPPLAAAGLFQE